MHVTGTTRLVRSIALRNGIDQSHDYSGEHAVNRSELAG